MSSLLEFSEQVHQSGVTLLEDIDLEAILEQSGRIVYTGSYAAHIMINRDIDLYLVKGHDFGMDEVLEVHNKIFQSKKIKGNILLGNNFHQSHPVYTFPKGFYLGLKTWTIADETEEREKWKIDIWMISEAELRKMKYLDLSTILTEEDRRLLLEIKQYIATHELTISSFEIYNAVFEKNCDSLATFVENFKGA